MFSDATGSEDSSTFLICDISRFSDLFGYFLNSLCLSIDYLYYGLVHSCTDVYVEQQVSRSYCALILNIVHKENLNAYVKMFA